MTDSLSIPQETPNIIFSIGNGSEKKTYSVKQKANFLGNTLDVIFVFDTTGSMDNKIEALSTVCYQFVEETKEMNLDANFALISFGDISREFGGDKITKEVDLTDDISRIKEGLKNITRNAGFGNGGETPFEAIREAFKIECRAGATKSIILITDEPALMHKIKSSDIIEELLERDYVTFVIATDTPYYKEMANKTAGIWKQISAHTNLNDLLEIFKDVAKKMSEKYYQIQLDGGMKNHLALNPPKEKYGG